MTLGEKTEHGRIIEALAPAWAEIIRMIEEDPDILFKIDPRPYQAQLDQAEGQVNLYKAQLELAKTTYTRYQALYASEPGAVPRPVMSYL